MTRHRTLRHALAGLRFAVVLVLLLLTLGPIYWILVTSIKPDSEVLTANIRLLPSTWTLDHYRNIFLSRSLTFYLGNSIIVALGSTVLSVTLGALAAYAFVAIRYPRGVIQNTSMWILSTRFIPPFAVVLPIFLIFRDLQLLDKRSGLIILHAIFSLPFVLWLLLSGFAELPREVEEAAFIDGASRLQSFRFIALPLAAPILAASAVFALLLSWNEFLFALLFTHTQSTTVPILVSNFLTDRSLQWGEIAASSVVTITPVIIFMLLAQRYLIRGLTMGAVKS